MDVIELAKFLNKISQNDTPYDHCSKQVKQAYQDKAKWIIEYFVIHGWTNNTNVNK
jgi:hypothetical protein